MHSAPLLEAFVHKSIRSNPSLSNLPLGHMQYFHKTAERRGVPVTRFTAAPGMLVRTWDESCPRISTLTHIGVIQPSLDMGDTCRVAWASGLELTYDTGRGNRFQLVHVEVSSTSGAPVVAADAWGPEGDQEDGMQQQGAGTTAEGPELRRRPMHLLLPPSGRSSTGNCLAVERGTHWTYGRPDPGVGILHVDDGSSRQTRQRGWLEVHWPKQQPHPYRASPASGYDLCYSARPRDPVTLFTARQGLSVDLGQDTRAVLDVPLELRDNGVVWSVLVKGGPHSGGRVRYLVESSGSIPLKEVGDDSPASLPLTEEPLRFA